MNLSLYNFWLYATGRLVSLIGSGIQSLALALYILDITGSGTMMGTFLLVTLLPKVVLGPVAGVVGDRIDRKKIMVYMDLARGVLIGIMAFLAFRGQMGIVSVYIFQLCISVMDIFFDPATGAMLPDIVKKEKLTRANSILGIINGLSYVIGPVLGGVLYPLGIGVVFLINAFSFVASGISEMFIKYTQTTEKAKITLKQTYSDIKEGFSFFRNTKALFGVIMFAMITNFIYTPVLMVVMPYFTRQVVGFSSRQFGLLESMWVLGILFGNLLIATVLTKKNQGKLFAWGIFFQIFVFIFINIFMYPGFVKLFGGPSWLYFGILSTGFVIVGTFNAFVNTPLHVYYQSAVPTEVRSRVFAVISVMSQLIVPLGSAIYGFAVDRISAHILVSLALLIGGSITAMFFIKGVMDGIIAQAARNNDSEPAKVAEVTAD